MRVKQQYLEKLRRIKWSALHVLCSPTARRYNSVEELLIGENVAPEVVREVHRLESQLLLGNG